MPNYRQFDDSRHFFDTSKLAYELNCKPEELIAPTPIQVGDRTILLGGILCEDGWDGDYAISPMQILADKNCDLFLNISASPFTWNKNHKRNRVFHEAARKFARPLLYTNLVGLQNNGKTLFTFDGGSCIYDAFGHHLDGPPAFQEGNLSHTLNLKGPIVDGSPLELKEDQQEILLQALLFGAKTFMQQIGVERVTIGVSGGIDSALAAALYSQILPPENLLLVSMPSRYNSQTTQNLAKQLATALGANFCEIPIEESVLLTQRQIDETKLIRASDSNAGNLKLSPFMLENVQARDRSSRILAAASSAFGGVFTCNANKSELTVGYGTLYGDICGFLALLADLWKTEVWELASYMNRVTFGGKEVIPQGSIDLVPSAELSADQDVDAGRGDPLHYPYHDRLFQSWVERWQRTTPEEALQWYSEGSLNKNLGYDGDIKELFPTAKEFITDLERWWKLYQGMALAKRIQAPPVLALKRRAFGFDHRESQLGPRFSQRYLALKKQLLNQT